jgi:hypothetical protein
VIDGYLILCKSYPGDITGTVGFSAHAAVAMCAPFAGQARSEFDRSAQATAMGVLIRVHVFLLMTVQ